MTTDWQVRSLEQTASPLGHRIDAVIDRALTDQRLVGAVVLVAELGAVRYQRAAGMADRESGQPMRPDALFRLASVSKPIVCAAALALVGQGRLQLDGDVTEWLPDFTPRLAGGHAPRISIRQLLTHTAGLGYRFFEPDESGPYARAGVSDGMDESRITLAENLRRIASVPLHYAPGENWAYSLAIDVVGALIEQVTGLPLPAAVRSLVTDPLGLADTGFSTSEATRLATAYVNTEDGPRPLRQHDVVTPFEGATGIHFAPGRALDHGAFPSGGAGMVGSAPDFLQLLETLRKGGAPLMPQALVAEMGRNQTGQLILPNAPGFGFGLGFSVLTDATLAESPQSPGTWRWGGAYGHSWFVDPARSLSVVAFTNTLYEGMSGQFVNDLRDAVYGMGAASC